MTTSNNNNNIGNMLNSTFIVTWNELIQQREIIRVSYPFWGEGEGIYLDNLDPLDLIYCNKILLNYITAVLEIYMHDIF